MSEGRLVHRRRYRLFDVIVEEVRRLHQVDMLGICEAVAHFGTHALQWEQRAVVVVRREALQPDTSAADRWIKMGDALKHSQLRFVILRGFAGKAPDQIP